MDLARRRRRLRADRLHAAGPVHDGHLVGAAVVARRPGPIDRGVDARLVHRRHDLAEVQRPIRDRLARVRVPHRRAQHQLHAQRQQQHHRPDRPPPRRDLTGPPLPQPLHPARPDQQRRKHRAREEQLADDAMNAGERLADLVDPQDPQQRLPDHADRQQHPRHRQPGPPVEEGHDGQADQQPQRREADDVALQPVQVLPARAEVVPPQVQRRDQRPVAEGLEAIRHRHPHLVAGDLPADHDHRDRHQHEQQGEPEEPPAERRHWLVRGHHRFAAHRPRLYARRRGRPGAAQRQ